MTQNCGINEETGLASCQANPNSTSTKTSNKIEKFTLKDQNGKTHNWEDYQDKVVLLHFWSTDCIACKNELPELEKLYEKYKELAKKNKNIIFGGRLAEYKYYDMAPVIEKALNIADITLR